jgi:mitochondrial inner membrane protease subunit 2
METLRGSAEGNDRVFLVGSILQPEDASLISDDRSPHHPDKQVVKRVIALEGDRVYTRAPYPLPTAEVPPGHVWVEGDGGKQSLDSHHYGPISKSLITGKIVYVVLPWSSFGTVRWDQYKGKTRVIKGQSHERLEWT